MVLSAPPTGVPGAPDSGVLGWLSAVAAESKDLHFAGKILPLVFVTVAVTSWSNIRRSANQSGDLNSANVPTPDFLRFFA